MRISVGVLMNKRRCISSNGHRYCALCRQQRPPDLSYRKNNRSSILVEYSARIFGLTFSIELVQSDMNTLYTVYYIVYDFLCQLCTRTLRFISCQTVTVLLLQSTVILHITLLSKMILSLRPSTGT